MSRSPRPVTRLHTDGRIGAIDLTWRLASWEPLVDHYAVYASESADVEPVPENLIGKTVYGRFTHATLGPEKQTRHYTIVTVDAAGERSGASRTVDGTTEESLVVRGRPLAQVGKFDSKSLELALAPADYALYAARFPKGVDFTVGKSNPRTDWSYLHPGPADSWAGRKQHTFAMRFSLQAEPEEELGLAIWLIDTHATAAGKATLAVNDTDTVEIEFRGGATRGSLEGDATVPGTALRPSFVELRLPARDFVRGENVISITKTEGSWHAYDAVGVFAPGAETPDAGDTAFIAGR
ncbi:polysaccharide lyase family 4-like protein [Murinocardiopsis flavida]|uniref:Polysaccharide lyase family 4-like protein n=1 Tax=Murinocardiopsis flavida TaxID=645275 RepID=A0A2P8DHV5_9ACTN|nr:polysaccharide lyase family protein [Murinocardiopsis flavida]PSK96797.1 polysaccharide lyase family 4-like protein [Murinocardiopsis flavida]